jgi:hypothetical protein
MYNQSRASRDVSLATLSDTTKPVAGDPWRLRHSLPWKRLALGALLAICMVTSGLGGPLTDTAQARPRDGRCYSNIEIQNWQAHADSTDSIHLIDTSNPAGFYCNENTVSPRPPPRPQPTPRPRP